MEKKKEILSMMEETRVFQPSDEIKKKAYIKTVDEYKAMYKKSIDDPTDSGVSRQRNLNGSKNGTKFRNGTLANPN